jgi:methyltransferase (TIGR00027 family)
MVKLEKVAAIFGARPPHVTYVAIDFDQQALADRLFESGYDERCKTLFIWQGVTQYLTPAAVDDTLSFVARRSAPGSSIIFDYMDPSLLGGAAKHGEITNLRRYKGLSGENLVYGIPIAEIETFLETRGFVGVENADHTKLERLYFSKGPRPRKVTHGYAIASAVVPSG